jgi:hypothetical protein
MPKGGHSDDERKLSQTSTARQHTTSNKQYHNLWYQPEHSRGKTHASSATTNNTRYQPKPARRSSQGCTAITQHNAAKAFIREDAHILGNNQQISRDDDPLCQDIALVPTSTTLSDVLQEIKKDDPNTALFSHKAGFAPVLILKKGGDRGTQQIKEHHFKKFTVEGLISTLGLLRNDSIEFTLKYA